MEWWNHNFKILSTIICDFLLKESFFQLVKVFTRSEVSHGNIVSSSCLDHVYSNTRNKCSIPLVDAAGDSDHLAILITKYSKEVKVKPQTVQKRNYKDFHIVAFLTDVKDSNIEKRVTSITDVDIAAKDFENIFRHLLDRYAPIKIFQTRKNYVPYLSD